MAGPKTITAKRLAANRRTGDTVPPPVNPTVTQGAP